MNRVRKNVTIGSILFLSFVFLTVIVKLIDVEAIGPEGSVVGLATINNFVYKHLGGSEIWDDVTDVMIAIAILVFIFFATVGLFQLFKRKNLKKIDNDIVMLGFFYIVLVILYVFFEVIIINYRPQIIEGKLEPSYPSSHVMIVCFIMMTAIIQSNLRIRNERLKKSALVICNIIIFITVVGRMASGVHWFTDILGGILLGISLSKFYGATIYFISTSTKEKC